MLVKTFDQGWGPDIPLKQIEQHLLTQILNNNNRRTVVINSTWYSQEYHQQVINALHTLEFDLIVLVSMLDAAIPQPKWFAEFECDIRCVGYYPGADFVDFWALVVNRYFERPDYDCQNPSTIDTAYMCLNRKPHWHRKKLFDQLSHYDLIKHGLVSFGGDNSPAVQTLAQDQGTCDLAPNAGQEQNGINNDIMSLGHPDNWQKHFLNIVTETQYDIQQTYFVSEKIYKPIVGFRPFLVYAADGAVSWLTDRGFEPYIKDFSDISDLDLQQPNNLALFIKTLSEQPQAYWQSKYLALKEKIRYNNSNFYNYIKGFACQI